MSKKAKNLAGPVIERRSGSALSKFALELIEGKNFAHIGTLMPDGSPQVTPVWIDHEDGKYVLVNTATGRTKPRNVAKDVRVAISVLDHKNPYRYVQLRGKVVKVVQGKEAEDSIDRLALKYKGLKRYPWRAPGEKRILFKIKPEHEFAKRQ